MTALSDWAIPLDLPLPLQSQALNQSMPLTLCKLIRQPFADLEVWLRQEQYWRMKQTPLHLTDTALLLTLTVFAWALAGWLLAVPVYAIGVVLMRQARKAPAESPEEAAEGRRRTYAQFQKDLNDPTGTPAVSIYRDLN
ncbi:MAG: hypothetical protein ACT4PZ_19000 [Panacagrimonas sp.]